MKPRRHLSNKLSAIGAATVLSLALTGITCGSFAWFAYNTRAKIEEFRGVAIGIDSLEMGIVSEIDLPEAENYNLTKDTSFTGKTIYWFNSDDHFVESETINYILSSNGYATNVLHPVTTKKYSMNDDFNLFSAPSSLSHVQGEAKREDYIYLPLVFRCKDIIDETYISDENIFLSQAKLNVLNIGSHIHESLRIYTNNRDNSSHLINPSSNNDGSTDVGGTLDLNGDGFYDADYLETGSYERIYGQVVESAYKSAPESDDTIVYPEQRTTFYSGHKAGVYALDSITPETANYEGMYGFRNMHKPVTVTNSLTDNLAFLDLSIFVEGWDLSVVDSEIGIPFSIDLKFEITF